jgi:hypothetical protein
VAPVSTVLVLLILLPLEAAAGLFGPSAGETAAMIVALVFGIPALVGIVALLIRARVKVAELKTRSSKASQDSRYDIFLSYSEKDHNHALNLSELIQQSHLKVFFARKDLEGGSPFTDEIRTALHESREVWVLASLNSIDSVWVATEWGTAWALERRIVPILLDIGSDQLPDRLRALHAVNWPNVPAEIQRAQKRMSSRNDSGK